jgi:hypothetical protein
MTTGEVLFILAACFLLGGTFEWLMGVPVGF